MQTLLSYSKWNDITTLKQTITQDRNNIEEWAIENKMFLNAKKTKSMLISGKHLQSRPITSWTVENFIKFCSKSWKWERIFLTPIPPGNVVFQDGSWTPRHYFSDDNIVLGGEGDIILNIKGILRHLKSNVRLKLA